MSRLSFRHLPLATFLLILVGLTGCRSSSLVLPAETVPRINPPEPMPAVLSVWPTLNERHPDVPEGYDLVAQNDRLRLYVQKTTSAVIVEDRMNGHLWRSIPADLDENKGVSATWRRRIEAPFLVSYVDAERSIIKVIKPEKVKLDFSPVKNGVKARSQYPDNHLEFSTYFTLKDDCLVMTIPDAEIIESGENSLVMVDAFSFFGATHDGEPGYLVYPDGSGALMNFTSSHSEAVQQISNAIYGPDTSSGESSGFNESLPMPVFGLSRGDAAFVGMVTQGDFDTNLLVGRSGKGVDYNHVWTQFVFRRQGRFSLSGGQPAWLYQQDRIQVDRQVRYCFLTGEQAGYVGMAARYRRFLMEERGARRIPESQPLMHLAFLMGTERRTWFLRDLISMTSFDQAREILDDLQAAGVRLLDISLFDWNRGGVSNRYPERLPVEKRLGGETALRTLAESLRARGQRLFLVDYYMSSAPGARGVLPYLDAMRGVDGLPVGNSDQGYMLNAQVALRKFAGRDIPKMVQLGANGLLLQNLGYATFPDLNNRYPLERENSAASWMQIASLSREQFGAVAVTGPNSYALPYADRMDYVPVDSTHYDLFDETIPFYQIVAHGLVLYTGGPYNLISDGQRMFLRNIEYGAIPSFILTHENSSLLYRTPLNQIWSSEYGFWREEVLRQYHKMELLAGLVNQFIIGHQRLAEGIYQTTFEDGKSVIVNYSGQDYSFGMMTIPAHDFLVVGGS